MYKRFLLVAICLEMIFSGIGYAQSANKVSETYLQFDTLRRSNSSDEQIYDALYACYTECVAVLNSSTSESQDFAYAKSTLRKIYPFLQNGAAYYSSNNNQDKALLFAQSFIDVYLMPTFKGEVLSYNKSFPLVAYFAASGTYNNHQYEKAIDYFRVYLTSGDQKYREAVFKGMAKACLNVKNYDLAMQVLKDAHASYPKDFNILSMAINACIDRDDYTNLRSFIKDALVLKPDEITLLGIQAKLFEDTKDYQNALDTYKKMLKQNPNSLNITQHIALNYYNLGIMYYNKANIEQTESKALEYNSEAKKYFEFAINDLNAIIANEPSSVKYLHALATIYSCLGNESKLENTNMKLLALGAEVVPLHSIPKMIEYSGKQENNEPASHGKTFAENNFANNNPYSSAAYSRDSIPLYSTYAKEYVESRIKQWQTKDPYETLAEYQKRVNEESRKVKIKELLKTAEENYINIYTKNINFNDLKLKPYDAEDRVFLVESKYGELIVPVPRENNEAKMFENMWSGMQFKEPKFYINNDKIMLSGLTFVTPTGKSYRFNGNESLNYTETAVNMSFDPINSDLFSQNQQLQQQTVKMIPDVDKNIPENNFDNNKTFAVIIANENYEMVTNVPLALNDGDIFSQYCKKTLGLPENNVRYYPDASYGIMLRAIKDIKNIGNAYNGEIKIIFYYAGHGIPNETSKDAFLLPIDADGLQTEGCYPVSRLYSELGSINAQSVIVFMDACFSGAKRNGGMLASARGIALKVKSEVPKGNTVAFSAASNDETAFPYTEKRHGLFTYFLLKKLQETKGNVTLDELGKYITENVSRQSILVNRKPQTPTIIPSATINGDWKEIKLIPEF